jgi:type I restriction enzyme, S subunit
VTLRVHPDEIVKESHSPLLGKHESWLRVRLHEVAEVTNGSAFKSSLFNSEGIGTPLIRIRDVGTNRTGTWYSGEFDPSYIVNPGDLLVGMDGDFRASRWKGVPALLNQRVCRIRIRNPDYYDDRLLEYLLQGYLNAVHEVTSSITVSHLSSKTIQDLPLPLPPVGEQRRIVGAIEEHFSRICSAEASMRTCLVHCLNLKAEVLNGAMKAVWPKVPLGDLLLSLKNGVFVSRPAAEPPGLPILRISAVRPMDLDLTDVRYAPVGTPKAELYRLEEDNLLFTRYNGNSEYVGACAVVPKTSEVIAYPDKLIRAVVDQTRVHPRYIAIAVTAREGRREIEGYLKTTAGQVGIAGSQLKSVRIPLPPMDEQIRLVDYVEAGLSQVKRLRATLIRESTQAASLRRSILTQAFLGNLVSHDPGDEPATVLLERIQASGTLPPQLSPARRRQPYE